MPEEVNIYEELIWGDEHSQTTVVASSTSSEWEDPSTIWVSLAQYLAAHPEVSAVQALIDVLQFANASLPHTPGVVNLKADSDKFEIDEVIRLLESLQSEDEDKKPIIIPAYVATAQHSWRDAINIQQLLTESPLALNHWLNSNAPKVTGRTNPESSYFQKTYYQLSTLQQSLWTKKAEDRKWSYDFKVLRKQSIEDGADSRLDRTQTALRHARIKVMNLFVVSNGNDAHDEVAIEWIQNTLWNIFNSMRTLLENMNKIIEKNSNDDRFSLYTNLSQTEIDEESITDINILALNSLLQKCGLWISISTETNRETARANYQQAWNLVTTKIQQLREDLHHHVLQKWEFLIKQ